MTVTTGQQVIHWRIAKAAKAIAAEAYEALARENDFHRLNRSPERYVRRNWRHYIPFARQALVGVLTKDYAHEIALGSYTREGVEAMKAEVYECLVLDGAFKGAAETAPARLH